MILWEENWIGSQEFQFLDFVLLLISKFEFFFIISEFQFLYLLGGNNSYLFDRFGWRLWKQRLKLFYDIVFEERVFLFQFFFLKEIIFCLVIQKKFFKEFVLDGNLISGGVGEDVFMVDIVQVCYRGVKRQ